jgi:hypothetical protein
VSAREGRAAGLGDLNVLEADGTAAHGGGLLGLVGDLD